MKTVRPFISLFLAGLVTLSAIGVIVNQHICMGHVQSTAVFFKAESCGMSDSGDMSTKGCCDEKAILIKTKTASANVLKNLSLSPSLFLITAIDRHLLYSLISFSPVEAVKFATYKPPLPDRDITVLVHSFLI
jgi:hypothetical protein